MGLGAAFFSAFLKLLFGYLAWVIFLTVVFAWSGWIKRTAGILVLLALILAPLLMFGFKVNRQIVRENERQRVDRIDLDAARVLWTDICAAPASLELIQKAKRRQSEILVRNVEEEHVPTYAGHPMSRPASSVIYPESPFTVALERVPIRADDELCLDRKPGYQCKNPTHAYRVRRRQAGSSVAADWDGVLHFTLIVGELKPASNRFIETQAITLTEDDVVLASGTASYFRAAADPAKTHCPDREQLVRSIIEAAFAGSKPDSDANSGR